MKKIPVRSIATPPTLRQPTGKFSIRDLSTLLGGKKLIHELHRHDFFLVLAVRAGAGVHEIDFTRYDVSDNSVFMLRPAQVHRLELASNSTGFLMEFDAAFYLRNESTAVERWKKAFTNNACVFEPARFNRVHSILNNIFTEFSTQEEGFGDAIKANLDIFFIEYLRQSTSVESSRQRTAVHAQERFDELLALLETNITHTKNVSQYAELLNLSPYQLNAITKATVGKTASALIDDQIILEAKRHLLATPSQVKDIAFHLGYEDVSYFIRFFKKHTSYSPKAFRQDSHKSHST